jgi:HK97 gp10 family phage protein
MIRAVIVGDPNKVPRYVLSKFPQIQGAVKVSMARLVLKLARKIKEEKLSGQVLRNKTGTLRRSISPSVSGTETFTEGKVSTNVEYARIHEFGGRTPPHVILPKRGRALAFPWKGQDVFFAKVNHPGSTMPERSFMRTALEEMKPEILEEFNNVIIQVVSKK